VTPSSPHVAAGLLKQLLRELPEPLLTFKLFDLMVTIAEMVEEVGLRMLYLRVLLGKLPLRNFNIFFRLLDLLFQVIDAEGGEEESYEHIATVFGPLLFRSKSQSTVNMIEQADTIKIIVADCIKNCEPLLLDPQTDFVSVGFTHFSYEGTVESEISFGEHEVIFVVKEDDSGWWEGEVNGSYGFFPSNYADVVLQLAPGTGDCAATQEELEAEEEEAIPDTQPAAKAPLPAKNVNEKPVSAANTRTKPAEMTKTVSSSSAGAGGGSKQHALNTLSEAQSTVQSNTQKRLKLEALLQSLSETVAQLRKEKLSSPASASSIVTTSSISPSDAKELQGLQEEIARMKTKQTTMMDTLQMSKKTLQQMKNAVAQQQTENKQLAEEIKAVGELAEKSASPAPATSISPRDLQPKETTPSTNPTTASHQTGLRATLPPRPINSASSSTPLKSFGGVTTTPTPAAAEINSKPLRPVNPRPALPTKPTEPTATVTTSIAARSALFNTPNASANKPTSPEETKEPSVVRRVNAVSVGRPGFSRPRPPGAGAPRLTGKH